MRCDSLYNCSAVRNNRYFTFYNFMMLLKMGMIHFITVLLLQTMGMIWFTIVLLFENYHDAVADDTCLISDNACVADPL